MATDLRKELAELERIKAKILGQLASETDNDKIVALENAQPMAKYGSKEHEALLATGYGFDKATAALIIKERTADPRVWPFEMFQKAQAFLEALKAKPTVISTREPWRVSSHARRVTTV